MNALLTQLKTNTTYADPLYENSSGYINIILYHPESLDILFKQRGALNSTYDLNSYPLPVADPSKFVRRVNLFI